eukprot:TRINITY_DN970_c0_g1_i9.p3 TRINITY_DN970_c0_g1~~TRINITY_DN970_c0_g1_i9.p3  ORF type:complete len:186 (+),score=-23.02 TRINITY_DN970_c0_g1_i9:720-1277(+)
MNLLQKFILKYFYKNNFLINTNNNSTSLLSHTQYIQQQNPMNNKKPLINSHSDDSRAMSKIIILVQIIIFLNRIDSIWVINCIVTQRYRYEKGMLKISQYNSISLQSIAQQPNAIGMKKECQKYLNIIQSHLIFLRKIFKFELKIVKNYVKLKQIYNFPIICTFLCTFQYLVNLTFIALHILHVE